ncbi:transposase [Usitatibacter rugosus]|uniref:transposase n=1 Tax=Usitatibacter rugosus TaxID=2732067 RepID=UPI001488BA68|nr:transposase [Usitatibacter rugosus]
MHVIQRGNDRSPCFRSVEDYRSYLEWLSFYGQAYDCPLHAYVLMTNHVHLLMTAGSHEGPSRLMQALGRRYVRHFNQKHSRTGTLWEGRFKAHPVQSDHHLLCLYRYIETNPVRAGMVGNAAAYRWSSFGRNGLGASDAMLSDHPLYAALAESKDARHAAYRALFQEELDQETLDAIRAAAQCGRPWGSPAFVTALSQSLSLPLARKNGRPKKATDLETKDLFAADQVSAKTLL